MCLLAPARLDIVPPEILAQAVVDWVGIGWCKLIKKWHQGKRRRGTKSPLLDWIGINILLEGICSRSFGSRYHRVGVLVLVPTAPPDKAHTAENEKRDMFRGNIL